MIKHLLGERFYEWFHYRGKLRDIQGRLVEEPEMQLLPRIVARGDNVVDIGANFAYYTVRLANLCPDGQVHAFEPIPGTFRTCEKIVRHHKLRNVHLHQCGVGEKSETLSFQVPLQEIGTPSAGQAHLSGRNNELSGSEMYHPFARHQEVRCSVVALDEPDWRARLGKVAFVKIDIEGAELFALRGMHDLLRECRPVVLIEVCPFFLAGFGFTERQLELEVEMIGYQFYRYNPSSGKLRLHSSAAFEDGNYILIHQSRTAEFADILETARLS